MANFPAMKKSYGLLLILIVHFISHAQVVPEWTNIYNGEDDYFDNGISIALDSSGNIFVGGTSVSITNGAPDYAVIKYTPAGEKKWTYIYDGAGAYEDYLSAIAVDQEGSVYVTGSSYEGSSRSDFVTLKITSSGSFAWKNVYKGLNVDNDDAATGIVVDDDGYVYVTGSSAGVSSSMWTDFATLKLNTAGDTVWTRRLGDGGMGNDRATAIAVDQYSNIYVTGYVEADVSQRYNYATVKYRSNGDTAWVRTYNGTGSDEDRAYDIAVDDQCNVFITGASWGTFYDDYATVKYDSNGVQEWVARYNGPVNSYDKAYSLRLDSQGNVYVTGQSGGEGANYDYCTIKYSSDGNKEWVARYNGPDNLDDMATSLAVDGSDNIYVTGSSKNAPSPYISTTDMVLVKYNSSGQEQWVSRFNGPGDNDDIGNAIAADQLGNVYVTGTSEYYGQQNSSDIFTVKYSNPASIYGPENEALISVFPVPANDKLLINYSCHIDQWLIYDLSGQALMSSFESPADNPFEIDISNLPGGIFLLIIRDNDKLHSLKFSKKII